MVTENSNYSNSRIPVPTAFEAVFSHFYFAQNKTTETITKTLLPSFQTILIFNFGAKALLHSKNKTEIEIEKCLVLGPIKQAFDYSLPPNSEILIANFKDDAFYRFFGNANVDGHLPINSDDLLNENCFTDLWAELHKINDTNQQVNYILEFCKPYLKQRNLIAEKLTDFKDETLNAIKAIAYQQQQTERNIQLNHKKHLGYSAKEISRYQRFLKAIELIQNSASKSLKIDVIDQCGYYDQSQFIHDFKHYTNISPTKYLKFQEDICNPKI